MEGVSIAIEFGNDSHPDKAFSILTDDSNEGGGIGIYPILHPEQINYGDKNLPPNSVGALGCILWFYREEYVDALISNLQYIKAKLHGKENETTDL